MVNGTWTIANAALIFINAGPIVDGCTVIIARGLIRTTHAGLAVTTANTTLVNDIAVTVAITFRDVRTAALVDGTWAITNATLIFINARTIVDGCTFIIASLRISTAGTCDVFASIIDGGCLIVIASPCVRAARARAVVTAAHVTIVAVQAFAIGWVIEVTSVSINTIVNVVAN